MWLDVAIILLCIVQTSVLRQHPKSSFSKSQEEGEYIYGSISEIPLDNKLSKQNDPSEPEYLDDEGPEESDTFPSEEPNDDGDGDLYSDEIQKIVRNGRQKERKHGRNKGVEVMKKVGQRNRLESNNDVESGHEDESEYDGSDLKGGNGGDQRFVYDSHDAPNRNSIFKHNRRPKRLTIVSREGPVSSSESSESADDLIVNESDDYDYVEKGSFQNYGQTQSVSSYAKEGEERVSSHQTRASLFTSSTEETNEEEDALRNNFRHDTKSKQHSNKPDFPSKQRNSNTSSLNSFAELTKAYNILVCAVESFMELANKTMNDKSSSQYRITVSEPSITDNVTSANTNSDSEALVNNLITTTKSLTTNMSTEGTFFPVEICTTRRKAEKGESTITCQPLDRETSEYIHSNQDEDDINSLFKKKHYKPPKADYVTPEYFADQGGMYVYNDYDSVDPKEDNTEVAPKPSFSPITHSIERKLWKDWAARKMSARRSDTEDSNEGTMSKSVFGTPNTTNDSSLITKSFSHSQVQGRVAKHSKKLKERRKIHPSFRENKKRKKHFINFSEGGHSTGEKMVHKNIVTDRLLLKNISSDKDDDTEIIEVEYL